MHRYRSHTCGALRDSDIGQDVRLSGWCHRIRDHGGLLFIDLRDHYGLTQCVADPDSPAFKDAEKLRAEWVVRIDGKVRRRPEGTENPDLPTGAVELFITEIEVLGPAGELPLPVFGEQEYPEDIRLKYRFLDLRRDKLHQNIMTRGQIVDSMRKRMKDQGFFEFQTPILTASSPGGRARLPGAVPDSSGKILRAAAGAAAVQAAADDVGLRPLFPDRALLPRRGPARRPAARRILSARRRDEFCRPRTTSSQRWSRSSPACSRISPRASPSPTAGRGFRSRKRSANTARDKPDLRNPIEMQDVSEHFRGSGFKVFARMLEDPKNQVWAIPGTGGGSRAFCDRMNSWAQGEGQPGLGYIMWREGGEGAGPLANNIGPERTAAIRTALGLKEGDAAFFVAGDPAKFWKFAGLARAKLGEELNLVDKDRFELAWIVDFPMYEYDETEKKIDFSHNPFSMPQGGLEALQTQDPLTIKAFQYDIVCNGYEIASGGIRNHRPDAMVKAFEIAGYGEKEVVERFGGMYRAFQYGAPPHGGMAAGVDRIVMLLCGTTNLREISLFPMNQRAEDLLMGAPSEVSPKQLRELHIRLNLPDS